MVGRWQVGACADDRGRWRMELRGASGQHVVENAAPAAALPGEGVAGTVPRRIRGRLAAVVATGLRIRGGESDPIGKFAAFVRARRRWCGGGGRDRDLHRGRRRTSVSALRAPRGSCSTPTCESSLRSPNPFETRVRHSSGLEGDVERVSDGNTDTCGDSAPARLADRRVGIDAERGVGVRRDALDAACCRKSRTGSRVDLSRDRRSGPGSAWSRNRVRVSGPATRAPCVDGRVRFQRDGDGWTRALLLPVTRRQGREASSAPLLAP